MRNLKYIELKIIKSRVSFEFVEFVVNYFMSPNNELKRTATNSRQPELVLSSNRSLFT